MSAGNPYESSLAASPVTAARRTMTLKQIDAISVGRMLGVFYGIIGLLFGAFVSLFALVGIAAGGEGNALVGVIFGIGAVVIIPVLYGLGGFIGGIIAAVLYNACASLVGGIKFELE
ncbi:hypothetical protein NHH03_01250 [Stieleria sp. TO1_6]|uniref:hypothetical protein n=1 Tax=Stieleria tagensis TaxID=2956795 RepID=UPI00209BB8ED|nr:hypothetical protein [Stieleria tagensis]MCO8120344.1 hypothetical protein [Stieleria tagensis]